MKKTGRTRKKMQIKSREWLEAECLRLAKQTRGGRDIQRVTIRRLNTKGVGPNWKAADLIPLPPLAAIDEVRAKFAHLPDTYLLDVDEQ